MYNLSPCTPVSAGDQHGDVGCDKVVCVLLHCIVRLFSHFTHLYAQVINMEENWNSCSLDIIGKVRTCCGVLRCVAACCSVLQDNWNSCSLDIIDKVRTCYSVLQCVAVCCSVLQCADFGCRIGTVACSALSARYVRVAVCCRRIRTIARSIFLARYIRVAVCCCRRIETVACSTVSSSYVQLCAVYGGLATMSRRLKIIGLFFRISSLL